MHIIEACEWVHGAIEGQRLETSPLHVRLLAQGLDLCT